MSNGNVILPQSKRKRDFRDLGLRGIVSMSMFGVFGGREEGRKGGLKNKLMRIN
jgi:hypothetical protein